MSGRPIEVAQRALGRTSEAVATPASVLAAEIKALVVAGDRDAADADEAVQDAFVKVFLHIDQYREELSFDVWFMRILVNACLDRLKSRSRQQRWMTSPIEEAHEPRPLEQVVGREPSSEHQLLVRERWQRMLEAVAALPDRQRLVFTLSHLDERTAGEISESTGMSPATVRVHLFRAIRKLRAVLGEEG